MVGGGEERFDDVLMIRSPSKTHINRMQQKSKSEKGHGSMKAKALSPRRSVLKSVRYRLRRKRAPAASSDEIDKSSHTSGSNATAMTTENEKTEDEDTLIAPQDLNVGELSDKKQDMLSSDSNDIESDVQSSDSNDNPLESVKIEDTTVIVEKEKIEDTTVLVKPTPSPASPPSVQLHIVDQKPNGFSEMLTIWANDLYALTSSPQFHRVLTSTGNLVSVGGNAIIHTALLPITFPMRVTSSVVSNAMYLTSGTLSFVFKPLETILFTNHRHLSLEDGSRSMNDVTIDETSETVSDELNRDKDTQLHEHLIGFAFDIVPIAVGTVFRVKDEIGSTVLNILGWDRQPSPIRHSPKERTQDKSFSVHDVDPTEGLKQEMIIMAEAGGESSHRDNATSRMRTSPIPSTSSLSSQTDFDVGTVVSDTDTSSSISSKTEVPIEERSFYLRICDLEVRQPLSSIHSLPLRYLELKSCLDEQSFNGMNQVLDSMVNTALIFSSHEPQKGETQIKQPLWKEEGSTSKHLKRYNKMLQMGAQSEIIELMEKEVFLWSGKIKRTSSHGDNIPMFKARGVIPFISPLDLVELLLDSSRVSMYNKFSNGRKDLCFLRSESMREMDMDIGLDVDTCANEDDDVVEKVSKGVVKIVETETRVPVISKVITTRTLLHARKLDDGAYILVSRSVETARPSSNENNTRLGGKNEIIWGVNVLRRVPGFENKVDMTNFSQANSTVVPNFLAHKVGVTAVSDFFKNLREMKKSNVI